MKPTYDGSAYTATPAGICKAARDGDVQAIDLLLAENPRLLTVDSPHNWTRTADRHELRGAYHAKPVEVAAFFNRPLAVKKLLEISRNSEALKGPFSRFLPFDGHFNALRIAVILGHAEVVDVIEADIFARIYVDEGLLNFADDGGPSVLYYAAQQDHLPLVLELLSRGAHPDPALESGRRVIHAILDNGADDEHRRVARQLLERGARLDVWAAAALDDVDAMKELLAQDAHAACRHYRPDRRRFSEGFPLVRACANGCRETVELLLTSGADVNADVGGDDPPEFGMPLIAAVYARHFELADVLLDCGASVRAHPNCAAPLVDMLYYATDASSCGWLAVSELRYATDDRRSHLQPNGAGAPEVLRLYERVIAQGAQLQPYSLVKMRHYDEIERLLDVPAQDGPDSPTPVGSVFHNLLEAAAWLGELGTVERCLALRPDLYDADAANSCIKAAIRSHNREGAFSDFRRIIELNLQFLDANRSVLTVQPLSLLATDFLENYDYGATQRLPRVEDLLNLAALCLEWGAAIDDRDETGCTALALAVCAGHVEYVDFLVNRGAKRYPDDPPEIDPVCQARALGFPEMLESLAAPPGPWGTVTRSDLIQLEMPSHGVPPLRMTPLDHARIQLGTASVRGPFRPKGNVADTSTSFVEFPEAFPVEQLENVRLIITNRDNPQIVGSATTGIVGGKQGFLLKARNCWPPNQSTLDHTPPVQSVSFSWMAVLPTSEPQPRRYAVRFGLIPFREYREFPGQASFSFPNTESLYDNAPFDEATGEKFVFLTTTVSGAANAAAAKADRCGIKAVVAHQTGHSDGGARLHWLVIAETSAAASNVMDAGYFDARQLWIHADRVEPSVQFDWQDYLVRFQRPFIERSPCAFVTANRHGVEGHEASVVGMSWNCRREGFAIKSRSFDTLIGQANFDYLAFGHCDVARDEVLAVNRSTMQIDPWDRFNDWNGSELAAKGLIGTNEFGPHGGSLLQHCTYERHQIADARKLLALGADVNQLQPSTHLTALHVAAAYGRRKMLQLLIECGADVHAQTVEGTPWVFPPRWQLKEEKTRAFRGETPLHLAMQYGHYDIVSMLLDAGADPNAHDCRGDRPIDYLPEWSTYPDNTLHWRLINQRMAATRQDYEDIIDWILSENQR